MAEEAFLAEEAVLRTGNEIKSEMSKNLVRQIQTQVEVAVADKKTVLETQKFILKNEMTPVTSNPISENSQGSEVSNSDSLKILFDGSIMTKEQLKARESLQVVENIKAHEGWQIKANINDIEESAREIQARYSDGFQISETNKLASESQSLMRSKLSDFSKFNEGFKVTEDLQGQTKVRVSEDLLTKEMFEDKRESLDEEWKEVREYQNKVFGFEGLYFLKKKELIEPIQDIIFESVERVAKKNRLQIIFDKSSEPVLLYTNPIHDYTDYVLEDLGLTEKNN